MASRPNRGDAVVAGGKSEVAYLLVHLVDVCFPGPERGAFRRLRLQPNDGKVSRVDPDPTMVEKFVFPPGLYFKDIGIAGEPMFVPYQREAVIGVRQCGFTRSQRSGSKQTSTSATACCATESGLLWNGWPRIDREGSVFRDRVAALGHLANARLHPATVPPPDINGGSCLL